MQDDLRRKVVAYEYWGFYDVDGTGVLTPIVATWIGSTMIRMELNPYPDQAIPLVVVPYMPVRKSLTGEADAELLEENQKILGAVMRGMIDVLGRVRGPFNVNAAAIAHLHASWQAEAVYYYYTT